MKLKPRLMSFESKIKLSDLELKDIMSRTEKLEQASQKQEESQISKLLSLSISHFVLLFAIFSCLGLSVLSESLYWCAPPSRGLALLSNVYNE